MKKIISLLLSIAMLVGVLSVNVNAFATGWAANAQNVDLDVWNNDYFGSQGSNYNAYKIYLSAKGSITIRTQNEYYYIEDFYVYKTNNIDISLSKYSHRCGYSSGGGYYYDEVVYNLSSGYYYVVLEDYDHMEFDFKISYKPNFSKTSISKLTAKDDAFKVKWSKCSNVSGYQIQYSRNSDMSSAKTIKISGKDHSSKTVKNLKNKKKYYVRIRTYKTVSVNGKNKTYYSKWSSKKSVKTK